MTVKYYSTMEAAKLLGISRSYIYWLRDTGKIKAEKIGTQYVIAQEEIDRYSNNHKEEARDS